MSVITRVPEPNLWELVCKEYEQQKPPFIDDESESINTDYQDYDPSKHNPVFYGKMHERIITDLEDATEVDVSISHPSCLGYAFTEKPPSEPTPSPPPPPPHDTCPPKEYLEHYIFPVLLPALEEMLKQAKLEKCFERRRTKFNALDFITEYLYRNNKNASGREDIELLEIPFVKEWLKDHPRPPLPLSLIWTEEEACLIIQSHWRGYKARCEPQVQELRQWQKEWREENRGYDKKVNEFWESKMPENKESVENKEIKSDETQVITTDQNKEIKQEESQESQVITTDQNEQYENNDVSGTVDSSEIKQET